MRTIARVSSTTTAETSIVSPTPSMSVMQTQAQRSPWHSPVPYLFGGLAAMLGLIAFALLILACSYWKLAGQLDEREGGQERDLENGDEKEAGDSGSKVAKVYEEKFLVIMAGDEKPTFLATPMYSKAASFGDGVDVKGEKKDEDNINKAENCETMKKEMSDHEQVTTEESRESPEDPEAQDHNQ
ncbi:protein GLUTAMINE DUMPER 1 [Castanea sativa]|uniref:protein GLUTAMINE DUMPER 1 n=1 Tax=Castanea sativa TaxID=21020 RepID=UPI003F650F46